jgi:hypothetical protein
MELVHPFVGKQNFDHLVAGPGTDSTVRYKRKNLVKESA